jgi:O-antigen ligase
MEDRKTSGRPNRLASAILFIAIGGAPLPFGSRDEVTIACWCFLLGLGLVLASTRSLRAGHYAMLGGIAVIGALYGFVLHEQLADQPWVATPNPIWERASELLGEPTAPSVSIIRGEPFYALGPPLANVLALLLGLVVGADGASANRALKVMAWAGVGYAVYGIFNLLLDPAAILWREKTANLESLTATFINRNTAAAYFGSCAAVWLVMAFARLRSRLPAGELRWAKLAERMGPDAKIDSRTVLRFGLFFVCLAAMFMTGSRGGVLVSLFAMVVASAIFFRRDLPRGVNIGLAALAAGALALALLQVLGGNVEARIDAGGLVDQGRLSAYQSTLRMIADHPWFGTGLGTFASAFPAYRSGDISIYGVWIVAHSTPLQLAAELGLPLVLAIAVGWLVALWVLIRGTRRSRRDTTAPLVALAVSLIALLHSSIDFSLQVAGFAIVVFAVLGVGLAQSLDAPPALRHHRAGALDRKQLKGEAETPLAPVEHQL